MTNSPPPCFSSDIAWAKATMAHSACSSDGGVGGIAVLESEYRFVLGSVILIHPPNILPERRSPNKQQEQNQTNNANYQVENNLLTENRIHALQFRGRHQRQKLVHEDEEADRKHNIDRSDPSANL